MVLSTLKRWAFSLAQQRAAPRWLSFVAFIESFICPIPTDILYIPMLLLRPKKAYCYALIATICSVLGGIVGWFIGHFAYNSLAKPILEFYGKYETMQTLQSDVTLKFFVILLIISGFSHIPPIKIATLLAGAVGVPLWLFVTVSICARGSRFYLFAWLAKRFGHQITNFVSRHFKWTILAGCVILLLAYTILFHFEKSKLLLL
ncbi:putative membrane protein [Bartonella australis AUST/NH1]|uniref:Putative membrane protein n=1 Tax=Bartonella australis (strain Aust/NH1) TaxID=1094489 RepID=M1P040_BARAA|nr:YqaA family protein [Bartonella australis]AGF74992.1 putative membrane protein [Bartonella australis AUST/NH1]